MECEIEKRKKFSMIYASSRCNVGFSQEKMASALGVSRKTIQNWESGISFPDYFQHKQWFETLGISDAPYMYEYNNRDIRNNKNIDDEKKLSITFNRMVEDLNIQQKRCISYLLVGTYQGDPYAMLQLFVAHAHLPMTQRFTIANQIYETYKICIEKNEIIDKNFVLPDVDILSKAIAAGREAAIKGEHRYIVKEE